MLLTVAVDKDTPFALNGKGMISGGYSQGTGPQLMPNAALYMMTQMTTDSFSLAIRVRELTCIGRVCLIDVDPPSR